MCLFCQYSNWQLEEIRCCPRYYEKVILRFAQLAESLGIFGKAQRQNKLIGKERAQDGFLLLYQSYKNSRQLVLYSGQWSSQFIRSTGIGTLVLVPGQEFEVHLQTWDALMNEW